MYDNKNEAFQASNLVGSYMGIYSLSSWFCIICFLRYTINKKIVHMISLICGGVGFLSMYFVPQASTLIFSFALIAGSILSMPYAMLSSSVDPKKWVFLWDFNMLCIATNLCGSWGINFLSSLLGQEDIATRG